MQLRQNGNNSPKSTQRPLTEADWVEIFYALDSKASRIERGECDSSWGDDNLAGLSAWGQRLRAIMEKLGPDASNMCEQISRDSEPATCVVPGCKSITCNFDTPPQEENIGLQRKTRSERQQNTAPAHLQLGDWGGLACECCSEPAEHAYISLDDAAHHPDAIIFRALCGPHYVDEVTSFAWIHKDK